MDRDSASNPLCVGGCGMYGSAATNNYCSQCYKEACRKAAQTGMTLPSAAPTAASPPAGGATAATASGAAAPAGAAGVAAPAPATSTPTASTAAAAGAGAGTATDSVAATAATPVPAASGDPPAAEAPPRKRQKNKKRCWTCKKKVGLTGFECKCSYVFCGEHRYAEAHSCDFDYKAMHRDILTAANVKVEPSKLDRL